MRRIYPFLLTMVWSCGESAIPDAEVIAGLTGIRPDRILEVRKNQLEPTPELEFAVTFESAGKVFVIGVRKDQSQWVRLFSGGGGPAGDFRKMMFISSGRKFSHVLLIFAGSRNAVYFAGIGNLNQELPLTAEELAAMSLVQEENSDEEMVRLGDRYLRYNGFEFDWYDGESPWPVFLNLQKGPQAILRIMNRGGFTSRCVANLGFPDIKAAEPSLQLTKDIPTVKLFRPGASLFHRKKGRTISGYPVIEIVKEPWAHDALIQLPFRMMPEVGRMTMRFVCAWRGEQRNFPPDDSLIPSQEDQQGYRVHRLP